MTDDDKPQAENFERRLQSIAQALMLALLLAIGATLWSLSNRAAQQEIVNLQTTKDITELKEQIKSMGAQATATAAALASVTTATAASLAASTAALAAAVERNKHQR